jgi:hypothetical protein
MVRVQRKIFAACVIDLLDVPRRGVGPAGKLQRLQGVKAPSRPFEFYAGIVHKLSLAGVQS